MTRHLLLGGGPLHDFAATTAVVERVAEEQGLRTTTVTEPDEAVALLTDAAAGGAEPFGLLTVDALRWAMAAPAYAAQRHEHAYRITDAAAAALDRHVRAGGGLLALHTAVICFDGHPHWKALCGAAWAWGTSAHPPLGPAHVRLTADGRRHPVTAGVGDFTVDDEVYGFLDEEDGLTPLLTSAHGGRDHPVVWAREVGAGRVVTDVLGHGPASLEHPAHRRLLAQAMAWARRDRPASP